MLLLLLQPLRWLQLHGTDEVYGDVDVVLMLGGQMSEEDDTVVVIVTDSGGSLSFVAAMGVALYRPMDGLSGSALASARALAPRQRQGSIPRPSPPGYPQEQPLPPHLALLLEPESSHSSLHHYLSDLIDNGRLANLDLV